jgi:hypothetical protein
MFQSSRLVALADRLAVTRVAGAAAGDAHDWEPLRQRWPRAQPDLWQVGYFQGGALDPRLAGCVVQMVSLPTSVAGQGPWPVELPDGGGRAAVVRWRLQRLDDDGFVEAEWDGRDRAHLNLRLGSRATLRAHARRGDGEAWAIRLYQLLEVVRDWTPDHFQAHPATPRNSVP